MKLLNKPITYLVQHPDDVVGRKSFEHLETTFKDTLYVRSEFATLQGEGPFAGQYSYFIRLAGCNYGSKTTHCKFCFVENETVHTTRGVIQLKDVVKGDSVFTLDADGSIVTTTVNEVLKRKVTREDLVCVEYQLPGIAKVKRLFCTKDHPFHTTKRGYVAAESLTIKDEIYHVTQYEYTSADKRLCNPMFEPSVSSKMAATTLERRTSGEIQPSVRSVEQKKRYSLSKLGDKNPMKRHDVRLANMIGHKYKQSKFEAKFEALFETLGVEATYVGADKKLVIGDGISGYRIPDFKLRGTRVVEIYHTTKKYMTAGLPNCRTEDNYENPTRDFYKQHGYSVLFLTEKDFPAVGSGNLRYDSDFKTLKSKIGMFMKNGAKVLTVRPLTTLEWNNRKASDTKANIVNLSCAPYNTFLTGGLHVHNCDTDFRMSLSQMRSFSGLREAWSNKKCDLVVVTGGEPTLQQKVVDLCIKYPDTHFQFETNGTQTEVVHRLLDLPNVTVVISPKYSVTGAMITPTDKMLDLATFKFLVSADATHHEYVLPEWTFKCKKPVYLSPIAVYLRAYEGEVTNAWDQTLIDTESTRMNYAHAANMVQSLSEYTGNRNIRLSIQQHLFTSIP